MLDQFYNWINVWFWWLTGYGNDVFCYWMLSLSCFYFYFWLSHYPNLSFLNCLCKILVGNSLIYIYMYLSYNSIYSWCEKKTERRKEHIIVFSLPIPLLFHQWSVICVDALLFSDTESQWKEKSKRMEKIEEREKGDRNDKKESGGQIFIMVLTFSNFAPQILADFWIGAMSKTILERFIDLEYIVNPL